MKRSLLFLFCLCSFTLLAQSTGGSLSDSLFHAFATLKKSDVDDRKQLAELKTLAAKLNTKYKPKKPKKSLQTVYDIVHDLYFTKYVENPVFGDIFTKGEYNCVTASALYAFLFEEMNIPYEIRETPTHVYVVAYPGVGDYTVESTLPAEGILNLREKDIEELKKEMIANKMVTPQEAASEDFAREYLLMDTTITLANLYGVQLFNYSLIYSEAGEPWEAAKMLETALQYHQTLYIRQVSMVNLAVMLQDPLLSVDGRCYVTTRSYKLFDELGFMPLQETLATLNELIPEGRIPDKATATNLQELADCIEASAIDSVLTKKIRISANKVSAFYHHHAKEIEESLSYLIENADMESYEPRAIIVDVIGKHLSRITNMQDGQDTLAKYETIFPFLKEDYDLQGYGTFFFLRLIYEHIELDEFEEALEALKIFESRFKPTDNIGFVPEYIGMAYGAISSYYVRKGDEKKAIDYLKRGMKYAKDSLELRRKLKLLESDTW